MAKLNPTQKYLHGMRAAWIRDTGELSDSDLDAMLGESGTAADPTKRNPNQLTSAGLVELLGVVIARSNRRLVAAGKIFRLDIDRLLQIAESAELDGVVDRVTANLVALERELSRRGPTARPLVRWILQNAERLCRIAAEAAEKDCEATIAEDIARFEGDSKYAEMLRNYFDPRLEADDTENKLAACCAMFDLDRESVTERAAILEYDAGMPRTTAAIRAAWYALRDQQPNANISEMNALAHFDYLDPIQGWDGVQSYAWMNALLKSVPKPDAASIRPPSKKAAS